MAAAKALAMAFVLDEGVVGGCFELQLCCSIRSRQRKWEALRLLLSSSFLYPDRLGSHALTVAAWSARPLRYHASAPAAPVCSPSARVWEWW